jgi:hypothetical protein
LPAVASAGTFGAVTKTGIIASTALALGVLIAYVLLTALNHDATALLGILVGQVGTVGVAQASKAVAKTGGE